MRMRNVLVAVITKTIKRKIAKDREKEVQKWSISFLLLTPINLGHRNILEYCSRPFANVHEMNGAIITNWNDTVKNDKDEVYILGDVGMGSPGYLRGLISQLNGRKYLIRGNHDKTMRKCEDLFEWVKDVYELTVQDKDVRGRKQKIFLSHYAHRTWPASHHFSWNLFGHSHSGLPDDPNLLSIDVGVDAIAQMYSVGGELSPKDYRPISYEEVKKIMVRRPAYDNFKKTAI